MSKTKKEVEITPTHSFAGTKQEQLQQLYTQWYACRRCFLGENRSQVTGSEEIVFASGNPDADIMFVGEAPGQEEENTSIPFVGPSGKLLNLILANVTDDDQVRETYRWYAKAPKSSKNDQQFNQVVHEWRERQFFFTNVVACRPPDNRPPNNIESKACWERLWNLIYIVDPRVIVAVGKISLSTLLRKQAEITKVRGQLFDVEFDGKVGKLRYPVIPILHPSFLLRKADWKQKGGDYEKTVGDVLKAMRIADEMRNKDFGTPIPTRVEL